MANSRLQQHVPHQKKKRKLWTSVFFGCEKRAELAARWRWSRGGGTSPRFVRDPPPPVEVGRRPPRGGGVLGGGGLAAEEGFPGGLASR